MAKNKDKKPAVEAPVVEKPEENVDEVQQAVVNPGKVKGLSQEKKVDYLHEVSERVREMRNEDNPPIGLISGYNMIRDAAIIDIAAGEIACGESAMGFIFTGNEAAYGALREAALCLGVELPAFKALPAPTKDQLKKAGLSAVNNQKFIGVSGANVSAETKKKKKAEKKILDSAKNKDYLNDLTKIENEDQLKEALGFQLLDTSKNANPVDRLIATAQFYRAYLEKNAESATDPKAELDKIHGYTLSDLLQDITTMVPPTFITSGFGKMLCIGATNAKSVVPAFNMFKRACTNRKTGVCKFSDAEIAAIVRVLMVWRSTSEIAEISKSIKDCNKNIEVLSKNTKANAKAIESEKNKIEAKTAAITAIQGVMRLATEPDFDIADGFIAAYNNDEDPLHDSAVVIFKSVVETYYKDVEVPELEFDSLLFNVQQYVGITLNLFNSPVGSRDEYSIENLISFEAKPAEEKSPQEKPTEEDPKNA